MDTGEKLVKISHSPFSISNWARYLWKKVITCVNFSPTTQNYLSPFTLRLEIFFKQGDTRFEFRLSYGSHGYTANVPDNRLKLPKFRKFLLICRYARFSVANGRSIPIAVQGAME
jgi:hypothetical protein